MELLLLLTQELTRDGTMRQAGILTTLGLRLFSHPLQSKDWNNERRVRRYTHRNIGKHTHRHLDAQCRHMGIRWETQTPKKYFRTCFSVQVPLESKVGSWPPKVFNRTPNGITVFFLFHTFTTSHNFIYKPQHLRVQDLKNYQVSWFKWLGTFLISWWKY